MMRERGRNSAEILFGVRVSLRLSVAASRYVGRIFLRVPELSSIHKPQTYELWIQAYILRTLVLQ